MDYMTIQTAIDKADSLMPNPFETELKVVWLSSLDRKIWDEIFATHEGCDPASFSGYEPETPLDTKLLVPLPYASELYNRYIQMMIAAELEETESYDINAALYNTEFWKFSAWYNRTHMPVNSSRFRF